MAKREKKEAGAAQTGAPAAMESIAIGGRVYPCRVTMGALVRFKRATGHDVGKLDTGDLEEMMTFLWCCVSSACRADGVELDMTPEDMADRMEVTALNGFYAGLTAGAAPGEDAEKKAGAPLT